MSEKTQSTMKDSHPDIEERIDWLTIVTGWHRQIFEKMTPEELEKIWMERVEARK
jgi:hypothetical protein